MSKINKEEFCKIMDALQRNEMFVDKLNDIFKEFDKDIDVWSIGLEETLLSLLETIFDDKENQWISYWIYEKKFGKEYEEGDVTESDGTIIPLRTAEELYDFLVKNLEAKSND